MRRADHRPLAPRRPVAYPPRPGQMFRIVIERPRFRQSRS